MINKKSVILVVFNNFKNDSRVLKEALSLQSHGFSVKVVALHEDSLAEKELFNTIMVHRIKLKTRNWPKNKFVQLIKYIEFLFRFFQEYPSLDMIHCNDLIALPVGVFAKIFINKKAKIIYDAHEYEIDDIPHQSKKIIKLKYYIEKFFIKYADRVITVSESIANEYKRLYMIPKPSLVLNCPPYVNVKKSDLLRKELGIHKDQTIFLYQGGLLQGRGIELLLEAFSEANDDENVVVFMGYGPLELDIQKKAQHHDTVFFKEAVSQETLLNYTVSADYGIIFYENSCLNHWYCLPNKLFEYIMAGIPVLVSNLFEMKNFVQKYEVGVVAETNTTHDFLAAIEKIKDMDRNVLLDNINKSRKTFTWENQETILLDLYKSFSHNA
jgi:glycosyltransferase involved in cell wall biosynthesis